MNFNGSITIPRDGITIPPKEGGNVFAIPPKVLRRGVMENMSYLVW